MSSQSDYKLHLSHRSSDGNSTTSHQSETASMDDNDATPPAIPPPPPPRRNTSFPIREDCWSEDATFTLINAWGEKFLQLNRGNLRQKHWQAVADAVNVRHGNVKKTRRSDVQCKNRIDTLKKKYKVEKCKVLELDYVSQWPFFASLDSLIGCNFKPSTVTPTPQPPKRKRIQETAIVKSSLPALPPLPSSVPVGRRSKRPLPPSDLPSTNNSFFRRNFSLMAAAAAAIDGADVDSDSSSSAGNRSRVGNRNGNGNGNTIRWLPVETDDPYHQLAEAIGRFSEVYERVEEAKQRQMVELEKQRMQFTKDLELQRMKLLIESQVQLEKLKRLKTNSEPSFCRSNEGDHSASIG